MEDSTATPEELEKRWIEHFSELFNQPGILGQGIDMCLPEQRVIHMAIKTSPFDLAELHAAVRDMNNDKAAGLDGYSIEVDKYIAGEQYLELELAMYNAILQTGDMPAIMRDVIITILYKGKGPRDNCDNYREISLMSPHKGKLLERLILNRIKPVLKDIIPANQFGFTEKCGTQDAMLVSRLLGIDATKRHTGLVREYIDLTKAYDKVNIEILWKILRLYGLPEEIVVVIIAFHEAAQAVLQLNGEISLTSIPLNRGLKQGSVLSLILFNIFFEVLITQFEKRCTMRMMAESILGVKVQYIFNDGFMNDKQIQPRIPGMRTTTIMDVLYADDCVIFANTIRVMQIVMVQFDEVSTLFGMELAISKTKVVCNQYSKAMEIAERNPEEHVLPVASQRRTRGNTELARMQVNDGLLFVPVILIRREKSKSYRNSVTWG